MKKIREEKQRVRDDFLEEYFLPLRKEFEDQIEEFKALWPLKDADYEEEDVKVEIIYSYDNVISEKKVN